MTEVALVRVYLRENDQNVCLMQKFQEWMWGAEDSD